MRFATLAAALGLITFAAPVQANPWALMAQIQYIENEKDGEWSVQKLIPEALKEAGEGFEITGFYVPVEAQSKVRTFLLVPDPADCPFCGTNGYGPTLEVFMRHPINDEAEGTRMTLRGTLQLDESPETYRAVLLVNAKRVD